MITTNFNKQVSTAERFQSVPLGRRLPLAGTTYQPAAPFDGGHVS